MPLVRIPDAFDHPEWLFEIKHDGFRALAVIEGHTCRLVSRRGHIFPKFGLLAEEIAHSVKAMHAVLDGEIVCLGPDGRSRFYDLLFRREWPHFYAFDVLELEGEDLRHQRLLERKRRLKGVLPRSGSRLLYVDHVVGRGVDLFREACRRDLEGIVGKWRDGCYEGDGVSTSWLKIKNPAYSQMQGCREVFEARSDARRRSRHSWPPPVLRLRTPEALAPSRITRDTSARVTAASNSFREKNAYIWTCIDNDPTHPYASLLPAHTPDGRHPRVRDRRMAQYQHRFGDADIRIDLTAEHGSHAARLFLVTAHGLSPLLNEQAQPVVVVGLTAALAYVAALEYLTERFGPGDIVRDGNS